MWSKRKKNLKGATTVINRQRIVFTLGILVGVSSLVASLGLLGSKDEEIADRQQELRIMRDLKAVLEERINVKDRELDIAKKLLLEKNEQVQKYQRETEDCRLGIETLNRQVEDLRLEILALKSEKAKKAEQSRDGRRKGE